jgi:hypothetical protein
MKQEMFDVPSLFGYGQSLGYRLRQALLLVSATETHTLNRFGEEGVDFIPFLR